MPYHDDPDTAVQDTVAFDVVIEDNTMPVGIVAQGKISVVNWTDADHAPDIPLEQYELTCTSYKVLEINPVSVFEEDDEVIVVQELDELDPTGL